MCMLNFALISMETLKSWISSLVTMLQLIKLINELLIIKLTFINKHKIELILPILGRSISSYFRFFQ